MSFTEAIIVFVAGLALSAISSAVMAPRLGQTTAWLEFPESLVGLVTALGADAPEIASAVTGIMSGHRDLGLGVIFGSNIFNLAALLGIGAIVAGCIRVGRPGILLNGAVALWITGVIAALAMELLTPLIVMVVLASVGLVRSALVLGEDLGISKTVLGTLVLAPLTGLPNLVTAIGLAKKGRGSAVVVETFNSNSLNVVAGVLLPIIVGLGKVSGQSLLSLWWIDSIRAAIPSRRRISAASLPSFSLSRVVFAASASDGSCRSALSSWLS